MQYLLSLLCSLESSVHYFEFLEKAFEGKIATDLLVSRSKIVWITRGGLISGAGVILKI